MAPSEKPPSGKKYNKNLNVLSWKKKKAFILTVYETNKLTCLGLWMVNLFLWTGDLMTIYNGYIHDPIWRKSCIKIATSFNAAVDILSYTFEIYSHHAFITENHFTKKERHWPRRCTIHQNCTPTKMGRGEWAPSWKPIENTNAGQE